MNQEEFDITVHSQLISDAIAESRYDTAIGLFVEVFEFNPDPALRIELFAGIAMAQVGKADAFTKQLTAEGLALRDKLGMTQLEAKEVASVIGTALKLQADGLSNVSYPMGEGENAKPE